MPAVRDGAEMVQVDVEEWIDLVAGGPTWTERTKNRPNWSSVLGSELDTSMRLPPPVMCIILNTSRL